MMRADAGLHPDQAGRQIGQPSFHLAARPLLAQHDRAALIEANDVERILADVDAHSGNCNGRSQFFGHTSTPSSPRPASRAGSVGARPDHSISKAGGFEGEPPEAVMKDSGTRDGTP